MKNTNFYAIRQRYWDYLGAYKAPKGDHREGIKFYMDLYLYSIGLDPDDPPQEYINRYMDTLDAFDNTILPDDEIEAGKIIDKLILDHFGVHPSWNDLF